MTAVALKIKIKQPVYLGSTFKGEKIDAEYVGLGNVDNTSDLEKPISNDTQDALGLKVNKVVGKGLSTEDYTTAEKTKLSNIEEGANNYIHPITHPPSIIAQDANNRFATDEEKSTWNNKLDNVPNDSVGINELKQQLKGYQTITGSTISFGYVGFEPLELTSDFSGTITNPKRGIMLSGLVAGPHAFDIPEVEFLVDNYDAAFWNTIQIYCWDETLGVYTGTIEPSKIAYTP